MDSGELLELLEELVIVFCHQILLVLGCILRHILFILPLLLEHFLAKEFKYFIIMQKMTNQGSLFVSLELIIPFHHLRRINEIISWNKTSWSVILGWVLLKEVALTSRMV